MDAVCVCSGGFPGLLCELLCVLLCAVPCVLEHGLQRCARLLERININNILSGFKYDHHVPHFTSSGHEHFARLVRKSPEHGVLGHSAVNAVVRCCRGVQNRVRCDPLLDCAPQTPQRSAV